MDRPISPTDQRRSRLRGGLKYVLIATVLVAGVFGFRHLLRGEVATDRILTATVQRGNIEESISATGQVVPAFEEQINAPVATQIREVLLRNGTTVAAGDRIMELNPEFIRLDADARRDQLELRRNNITKLKLEFDKHIAELDYDNQILTLRIGEMEAALADARRLHEIGGATAEDVERARLALEIAKLEQAKIHNELTYRRAVVGSNRRNLELELAMEEKTLRQLDRKLQKTTVTAPRAGVITWINEDIGRQVNEGEALARIADLSRFRIEAAVSDRYDQRLAVGMPARVRINGKSIDGTVSAILPEVKDNTVRFIVEIGAEGRDLLKPNLRVDISLVVGQRTDVLVVDNGPAFTGGKRQEIFVVRGGEAVRVPVEVGLSSRDEVEIVAGIEAGERVIVSSTEAFKHRERVTLN